MHLISTNLIENREEGLQHHKPKERKKKKKTGSSESDMNGRTVTWPDHGVRSERKSEGAPCQIILDLSLAVIACPPCFHLSFVFPSSCHVVRCFFVVVFLVLVLFCFVLFFCFVVVFTAPFLPAASPSSSNLLLLKAIPSPSFHATSVTVNMRVMIFLTQ